MIKENQKLFNRLNIITDALAAVISIAAAYTLVFHLLDFEKNYPLADYLKLLLIFIPLQLMTYGCMGLYDSFRSKRFTTELGRLTGAFLLDGLALVALLYVIQIINMSRWALAIFLTLDFVIVALKRYVLRRTLRKFRESGYNRKYVLIVGSGAAAQDYLRTIREEKHFGFECAGYVSDAGELPRAKRMGGFNSLLNVLEERSYDEVVCALDADDSEKLGAVVEACELTGTKISVIPTIYKYMSSTPAIDVVGNIPVMNIRRIPLDNIGNAVLKRATDIVGSLLLLIVTSPVILISMLVIKLTMGGRVIFRQKRVGLNKKVFTMYKLKSMRDSAESDTAWSTDADPRRTKFGSFIRKFSIDELPQLINVLKGDMSLVGPRPEIPFYVNDFKNKIPMYMIKHQVKPGITGLAQVNGYRGDTSIEKRIEYDVQYIENWSFFLDISILLRTALSGFMNKEKLSPDRERKKKIKPYKAEKYNMTNKDKGKIDLMALAMFLPSVIALALIPVIIHVSSVVTDLKETYMYFGGNVIDGDSGTSYQLFDMYSQSKGLAIVVLALIMIGVALVCCLSLFRRIEKRSLVYVGCSVAYVIMTLASAMNSQYAHIAFYGEYDRAEGFFTTACYFVMFLFTMYAFRTSGNFKFVAIALFICVGVNTVMGIFQITGNSLLQQDWFRMLITDPDLRDQESTISSNSTQIYGALYNSNYVGSFTGLIIPLFSVMAIYSEKKLWKILYIVFDLMAVVMLVGSSARSGVVALAAALVVGIIVFARQIGKHWKRCVIIAASAAVVVVGANFVTGNKLFSRVPSLINDAVGLFLPSDSEDSDLYSHLPLREISAQSDGSMKFTGQSDYFTMSYDPEAMNFTYTNSAGEPVAAVSNFTFDDAGFSSVKVEANYNAGTVLVSAGDISARLLIDESGVLSLDENYACVLFSDKDSSLLEIGSLGIGELTVGDRMMYIEYDPDYKRLFFTDENETDITQNETISFSDEQFKDVHFLMLDADGSQLTRDVFAMYFNDARSSSLFFNLKNEKKLEVINYRTADAVNPVNAEHIGFEGKEKIGSSRGYIWSRTLPLLKNCLITGYGPDTYAYIFPQNDYLAKYYSYQDFGEGFYITVDKPHNLYLQIFFSNGLIALIAFLAIVIFYLVDCFRLYALRKEYRSEQIMGAAVMLGIVGYLAAGLFNDSVVHVAPVFWILLGTGAALNTINRRADRNIAVDEDYVPVADNKSSVLTAEQAEKEAEIAAKAQRLSELYREELEAERAKKANEAAARKQETRQYTKEDMSNLLESVRALREKYEAEKPQNSEEASAGADSPDTTDSGDNKDDNV